MIRKYPKRCKPHGAPPQSLWNALVTSLHAPKHAKDHEKPRWPSAEHGSAHRLRSSHPPGQRNPPPPYDALSAPAELCPPALACGALLQDLSFEAGITRFALLGEKYRYMELDTESRFCENGHESEDSRNPVAMPHRPFLAVTKGCASGAHEVHLHLLPLRLGLRTITKDLSG